MSGEIRHFSDESQHRFPVLFLLPRFIIYRGVCHNLSEFISAMDAIDEALIFFEDNQPECPEINQLRKGL